MTRISAQPGTVGGLCPADPSHGPLIDLDGIAYCPHQGHDSARIRPAPSEPEGTPRSSDSPEVAGVGLSAANSEAAGGMGTARGPLP